MMLYCLSNCGFQQGPFIGEMTHQILIVMKLTLTLQVLSSLCLILSDHQDYFSIFVYFTVFNCTKAEADRTPDYAWRISKMQYDYLFWDHEEQLGVKQKHETTITLKLNGISNNDKSKRWQHLPHSWLLSCYTTEKKEYFKTHRTRNKVDLN